MTTSTVSAGTRVTSATQRAPRVCVSPCSTTACRAARDPGRGRSRSPARPSIAGTAVSATRTATATATAAATPITARNGIRATTRPQSAITTVVPAKITALPAVAIAWAADSSASRPSTSWLRCRDTMNSA